MIHHGNIISSFSDRKIGKSRRAFSCVDICEDLIAVGSTDGSIEILQLKNFDMRQNVSLLAHIILPTVLSDVIFGVNSPPQEGEISSRSVTTIRISECLNRLAFGTASGDVYVFNVQNIHSSYLIGSHSDHRGNHVRSLCWSPNSQFLVSGCEYGKVIEWTPVKNKVDERVSLTWAKSLLGMRSGLVLHTSSSSIGQLDIAIRSDNTVSANTNIDRYLLLVSTGDQSLLLDVQRVYTGKQYESTVLKTVRIEPGIYGSRSKAASLFANSPTTSIFKKSSGFLSCRKGNSTGPELVYCDADGENYQLFNLKLIHGHSNHADSSELSSHIAQDSSNCRKNGCITPFGFKYVVSSDDPEYRRLLFVVSDNNRLCIIDVIGLTVQFFPLFADSIIDSISFSDNKLIILRHDELSGGSFIDLLEIISPRTFTSPILIYNSSVYRAVKKLQHLWRQRYAPSDVWKNIVSSHGKETSLPSSPRVDNKRNSGLSSSTGSTANEEDEEYDYFPDADTRNRPIIPSRSSSTSSGQDDVLLIWQQYDKVEAMVEKALNIADGETESAIFSGDSEALMFSDFYSTASGASWNIDQIALHGLPITTDTQGRVKSLPEGVVEQLRCLHACVSDDKSMDAVEVNRRRTLKEVITSLDTNATIDETEIAGGFGFASDRSVVSSSAPRSKPRSSNQVGLAAVNGSQTSSRSGSSRNSSRDYDASIDEMNEVIHQNSLSRNSSSSIDQENIFKLIRSVESTLNLSEIVLRASSMMTPANAFISPKAKVSEQSVEVLMMDIDDLIASSTTLLHSSENIADIISAPGKDTTQQPHDQALLIDGYNTRELDEAVDSAVASMASVILDSIQMHTGTSFEKIVSDLADIKDSSYCNGASNDPSDIYEYMNLSPSTTIARSLSRSSDLNCTATIHAQATKLEQKDLNLYQYQDERHIIADKYLFSDTSSDVSDAEFMHESSTCWIESWWTQAIDQKSSFANDNKQSVKSRLMRLIKKHQQPSHIVSPTNVTDIVDAVNAAEPMVFDIDLYAPMGLGIALLISPEGNLTVKSFKRLSNGEKGPAELSGHISTGDQIIGINGENLENVGVEKLSNVFELCYANPGYITLKMRSRCVVSAANNSLQLYQDTPHAAGNPLLDLFGPTFSLSVGEIIDSPDDNDISLSADLSHHHQQHDLMDSLAEKLEVLGLFVGVLGDGESSYGLSPRLSHRSISGVGGGRSSLKDNIHEQIRSNHIYPEAAATACILEEYREADHTPSDEVVEMQRQVTDMQYSRFFADSKYPKLIRSPIIEGNEQFSNYCIVTQLIEVNGHVVIDGLEAISGRNYVTSLQHDKVYALKDEPDTIGDANVDHQQAEKMMRSPHGLQDILRIYTAKALKSDAAIREQYFEDILMHLQAQSKRFANFSLRRYLKKKLRTVNSATIHQHTTGNHQSLSSMLLESNPFEIHQINPVDIAYGSELGIYLPEYSMTLQLYLYVVKILTITGELVSQENSNQRQRLQPQLEILDRLVKLFEAWLTIFIPLNLQYRAKLWSSTLLSEDYCRSHGFHTARDMQDYLRLVNELTTLYVGICSLGPRFIDVLTSSITEPKKFKWTKFLPGSIIRETLSLSDHLEDFIWTEAQVISFTRKYGAYLHLDFCLHCSGIRQHSASLQLVLETATYGYDLSIASNLLRSYFDSRDQKYVSARIIYKAIADAVAKESVTIFCALFNMLGSLFRRDEKLACELAATTFPSIGPWIVKYILFGDHWSTAVIVKPSSSLNSSDFPAVEAIDLDLNAALASWHQRARVIYQNYLQIIVRRYRCNRDESIVMEWLELLLSHAHLETLTSTSAHMQNILAIIQHPDIHSYNPVRAVRLCARYTCYKGIVECCKECFLIAGSQASAEEYRQVYAEFEPWLIEATKQAARNLSAHVTRLHRHGSEQRKEDAHKTDNMSSFAVDDINLASEDLIKAIRLLWISKSVSEASDQLTDFAAMVALTWQISLSDEMDEERLRASLANAFASALVVALTKSIAIQVISYSHTLTRDLSIEFYRWLLHQP
jgi:hypothetical protein